MFQGYLSDSHHVRSVNWWHDGGSGEPRQLPLRDEREWALISIARPVVELHLVKEACWELALGWERGTAVQGSPGSSLWFSSLS